MSTNASTISTGHGQHAQRRPQEVAELVKRVDGAHEAQERDARPAMQDDEQGPEQKVEHGVTRAEDSAGRKMAHARLWYQP